MEETARAGWAARGVLYLLVALLMSQIGTGGDREADRTGAIEAAADAPFGGWLLGAIAAGLAAFAAYRLWAAIRGAEEKPLRRLGWVGSVIVYGYLAATAVGVLLSGDDRSSGGESDGTAVTATVIGWPIGPWLVGAAGLVGFGVAANFIRKAVKERFRHEIDENAVPRTLWPAVRALGVAGWLGRALVWALVGWFLIRAAVQHDPNEPVGFDRSLRALTGEPWGPLVLWLALAGFLAYGLLCLATAAWIDEQPDS